MSRKFLYRRLGSAVIVILTLIAAVTPRSAAQDKPTLKRPGNTVPDDRPPETKKTKKVKGPRAVGVLQLPSSGKGTLIPIAILIDGKFYDASVYKADPVPMALESGTVYEVEQAGDSQGLFTISGALHSTRAGSTHPWVGAGSYLPQGTEAPKSTRKAEDVPVGIDSSGGDEPPRLTRGKATKSTEAASNPSAAPTSGTGAAGGSPEKSGAAAPPASAQPSGGAAGTSSGPSPKAPGAADKPADQAAKEQTPQTTTAPGQAGTNQVPANQTPSKQTVSGQTSTGQESENYYRPTLRRGKPTQSAPQEDEPVAKADKTGSAGGTSTAAAAVPMQTMAAISDAGGPDPRSYQFFWKTGEEDEQRKKMLDLAADEVRSYWNARAKGVIGAKAPAPATKAGASARKAPSKPAAQPVLENIQFHTFDVWVNNQPVMIVSADAHLAPAPGATTVPEPCSITLVARTDIYGNLRKLYAGVTDKFHLDVTPRLELIDAVDADGDGRGELLFRETTDAGSGYVIYRATADKLWKMFDSRGE
jgi:hypothetical protein